MVREGEPLTEQENIVKSVACDLSVPAWLYNVGTTYRVQTEELKPDTSCYYTALYLLEILW